MPMNAPNDASMNTGKCQLVYMAPSERSFAVHITFRISRGAHHRSSRPSAASGCWAACLLTSRYHALPTRALEGECVRRFPPADVVRAALSGAHGWGYPTTLRSSEPGQSPGGMASSSRRTSGTRLESPMRASPPAQAHLSGRATPAPVPRRAESASPRGGRPCADPRQLPRPRTTVETPCPPHSPRRTPRPCHLDADARECTPRPLRDPAENSTPALRQPRRIRRFDVVKPRTRQRRTTPGGRRDALERARQTILTDRRR